MPQSKTIVQFSCGCRKTSPIDAHSSACTANLTEKKCEFWCTACDSLPSPQKEAKVLMLGRNCEVLDMQVNIEELRRVVAAELPRGLPGYEPGPLGRQVYEMSEQDQIMLRQADERFFRSLGQPEAVEQTDSRFPGPFGIKIISPVDAEMLGNGKSRADAAMEVEMSPRERQIEKIWQRQLERDRHRLQQWLDDRQQALGGSRETLSKCDAAAAAIYDAQFREREVLKEKQYTAACIKYAKMQSPDPMDDLKVRELEAELHAKHEERRARWNLERRADDDLFGSGYRAQVLAQCLIHGDEAGCGEACRARCAIHGENATCGVSCRAAAHDVS